MNAVNLIPLERRRGAAPTLPGRAVPRSARGARSGARRDVRLRRGAQSGLHAARPSSPTCGPGPRSGPRRRLRYAAGDRRPQAAARRGSPRSEPCSASAADWQLLLGQLAGVMPAHAELTSMSAAAERGGPATSGATTTCLRDHDLRMRGLAAGRREHDGRAPSACRASPGVSVNSSTLQSAGTSASATSSGSSSTSCPLAVAFSLTSSSPRRPSLVQLLEGAKAASVASPSSSATARAHVDLRHHGSGPMKLTPRDRVAARRRSSRCLRAAGSTSSCSPPSTTAPAICSRRSRRPRCRSPRPSRQELAGRAAEVASEQGSGVTGRLRSARSRRPPTSRRCSSC